jgi:hypothetical protein
MELENSMKLEIGKSYTEIGIPNAIWTCVNVLECKGVLTDNLETYGFIRNYKANVNISGKFYCVIHEKIVDYFYEEHDYFYEEHDYFLNVHQTRRKLEEVSIHYNNLPGIIQDILKITASKRFVSFFHAALNGRFVVCIDKEDRVCRYGEESLPSTWPLNVKVVNYIPLDITVDQYLNINDFKVKTKEDKLKELEEKVINEFGCQKEHLAPILKTFIQLMKQIKESKTDYKLLSNDVMASILTVESKEVSGSHIGSTIYNLLKQIQELV